MPRTNREETKEKRVPFKNWAGPNCSNKWDFYDSVKRISFCRKCKVNFFCFNEATKIKVNFKTSFKLMYLLYQFNFNLKVDYRGSRNEGYYRMHI